MRFESDCWTQLATLGNIVSGVTNIYSLALFCDDLSGAQPDLLDQISTSGLVFGLLFGAYAMMGDVYCQYVKNCINHCEEKNRVQIKSIDDDAYTGKESNSNPLVESQGGDITKLLTAKISNALDDVFYSRPCGFQTSLKPGQTIFWYGAMVDSIIEKASPIILIASLFAANQNYSRQLSIAIDISAYVMGFLFSYASSRDLKNAMTKYNRIHIKPCNEQILEAGDYAEMQGDDQPAILPYEIKRVVDPVGDSDYARLMVSYKTN